MINFVVLTIFPEMFDSFLGTSIIKRAIDSDKLNVELINIRDFSLNKHKKVDFKPCGASSGMIMSPEPIARAIDYTLEYIVKNESYEIIYLSPRGKVLNYDIAKEYSDKVTDKYIILLCGHYEGIDERILKLYNIQEISIGDYVLTGGELPAMIFIDSVSRLSQGVISEESLINESHTNKLLEYPQYTKPVDFRGMKVPEILLSGNHKKIEEFNLKNSILITKQNRPDLLKEKEEK